MLEILHMLSKTGDQFSVFYFKLGIGKSVKSFECKFIVPRYLNYSCLK